ncbi:MAG: hypothetical protein DCF32_19390 [Leptolyngbya sp.]|nr:MAG: hypothetical protein DCF32_19390 [Leptolyngbya sp.]
MCKRWEFNDPALASQVEQASAAESPPIILSQEIQAVAEKNSASRSLRSQDLPEQELRLGSLSLGDEGKTVIREFGQPSQVSSSFYSQLDYPGFTVLLEEGTVIGMTSTSDQYCTPSGVCPGMDFGQVRERYSVPVVSDREDGSFMEYYPADSSCWLKLAVDSELVESISVVCQP